jgi:WD40 repeat protein
LDIYNLYLKDIYVNPSNTKTIIKSILEIPEENLIVTGSDFGEIKIFHFNKNFFQYKNTINDNKFEEKIETSLKLIHEIKVFDSPIKSMVFMPCRELASYLEDKKINIKIAESLKLRYYLVCSCLDGHMSLINLRNFNEQKIYPIDYDDKNPQNQKFIKASKDKNNKNYPIIEEKSSKEKKVKDNYKINININEAISKIEKEKKNDDFLEDIIIESFKEEPNKEKIIEDKNEIIHNINEESNLEVDISDSNSELILNSNISNIMKLNTINLPIYSMVYIPNRKTVLFSQGTDIFEFNNFSVEKGISCKNVKYENAKIRVLISEAHKDEINLLYFIKERNILISCSKDKRILLWDFNDPNKVDNYISIGELAGSTSRINSICSGYIEGVWHIASLSKEGIVNFWNLENKEKSKTITFPFNIKSIQFSGYENIFFIIKKSTGFILFDAFDEQFKEFCNLDKVNKDLVMDMQENQDAEMNKNVRKHISAKISNEKINKENMGDYILNIRLKKIENIDIKKLNLLSLRLMSKYTCGILVGNQTRNIENENDTYYAIFANKLGNLDVWTNFD